MDISDPQVLSLIIGAVGVLATALGAVISQAITAWTQRHGQKLSEHSEILKIKSEEEKFKDSSSREQIAASTNAVTHIFDTLTECLESRASIQDELRIQLLCNAKREIKIQKALATSNWLLSEIASTTHPKTELLSIVKEQLRLLSDQLSEKVNGLDSHPGHPGQKGG